MGGANDPQRRVRQIRAFRDECEALEREGVFQPSPAQRAAIEAHHAHVLTTLSQQFDVDVTDAQHSLSLGMRLTTLVGAVALATAVLLVLRRFWGWFVLPAQVGVAISAPALAFLVLDWSARTPGRRQLTEVLTLVAFAATVANIEILGSAFGFAPSPLALLVYGVVGVALALAYDGRAALVAGASCLAAFAMTVPVTLAGAWWTEAIRRPETAILIGIAYVAVPSAARGTSALGPWWRGVGLSLVGTALIMLSLDGTTTWLPSTDERAVEVAYTVSAFVVGLVMIVVGARRRLLGVSIGGAVLVLTLLAVQYTQWGWRYVPQWLFFLLISLATLMVGWGLQRLRRAGGTHR